MCSSDLGGGSGCISASEPSAVSRLCREGRTFAASWKKSSCGSGFVSVLDSAFALNSKDIGRCFLFPRRMIWSSSPFRRGPMRPFPLRGICTAWSDEPCRSEAAPVHGLRRNTIRTQASAASARLSGSGRSLSPLFVNRGGMPFGTGVGSRTAEGQLQFGFGLFETDAARSLDEDRPVADGMTGQMGTQRVDVGKDGETTRSGCREVGPY